MCKEKVIFNTGIPFFLFLPPKNEFLQTFSTINAHKNDDVTIKHWEKILCEVFGGFFWSFFASISPRNMVTWM